MLRTPVGLQGIYKRAISTIQLDTGTRPAPRAGRPSHGEHTTRGPHGSREPRDHREPREPREPRESYGAPSSGVRRPSAATARPTAPWSSRAVGVCSAPAATVITAAAIMVVTAAMVGTAVTAPTNKRPPRRPASPPDDRAAADLLQTHHLSFRQLKSAFNRQHAAPPVTGAQHAQRRLSRCPLQVFNSASTTCDALKRRVRAGSFRFMLFAALSFAGPFLLPSRLDNPGFTACGGCIGLPALLSRDTRRTSQCSMLLTRRDSLCVMLKSLTRVQRSMS